MYTHYCACLYAACAHVGFLIGSVLFLAANPLGPNFPQELTQLIKLEYVSLVVAAIMVYAMTCAWGALLVLVSGTP